MSDSPIYAMLVEHEVADFDKFKAAFDAHEPMRREAGFKMHNIHRDSDNPNKVVVFLGGAPLEAAQAFASAPELKDAMAGAGVVGAPTIRFMQNREMKLATEGATAGALISHRVNNYVDWKAAFDSHESTRTNAGALGHSVNTLADDENEVVAYTQSAGVDAMRAFVGSAELKSAMTEAGVAGPPSISFLDHVEMKRYE